jgi:glycosyltransferase involved in cell wall biosynthesis
MKVLKSLFSGPAPWTLKSNLAYETLYQVDVSVVVTLYNYQEYIGECLESLVAAIRFDPALVVEVIVVDDASTDSGAAVVMAMAQAYPDLPLLLVKKSQNSGLSRSRNLALKLARGQAAFILDADNLIKPACLSLLYDHLRQSEADAVYPCIEKFWTLDGKVVDTVSSQPFDLTRLLSANYIDAMAMFSVKSLFEIGLYDVGMVHGWEDYDVWLSMGFAGLRVESLPRVLGGYRLHADSMLIRFTSHALEVGRYLYDKHRHALPSLPEDAVLFGSPLSLLRDGEMAQQAAVTQDG